DFPGPDTRSDAKLVTVLERESCRAQQTTAQQQYRDSHTSFLDVGASYLTNEGAIKLRARCAMCRSDLPMCWCASARRRASLAGATPASGRVRTSLHHAALAVVGRG